jgi:hypothetical protein
VLSTKRPNLRSFLYARYARAGRLKPSNQIPLNNQVYIWCHFRVVYEASGTVYRKPELAVDLHENLQ